MSKKDKLFFGEIMIEDIKTRILNAVKSQSVIEKNILKLLLGEMQNLSATKNRDLTHEEIYQIIKKFINNNNETMRLAGRAEGLEVENKILNDLLPVTFTPDQLVKIINANPKLLTDILQANSTGQAIGLAMKEIKSLYTAEVLGNDLKNIVESLRTSYVSSAS